MRYKEALTSLKENAHIIGCSFGDYTVSELVIAPSKSIDLTKYLKDYLADELDEARLQSHDQQFQVVALLDLSDYDGDFLQFLPLAEVLSRLNEQG